MKSVIAFYRRLVFILCVFCKIVKVLSGKRKESSPEQPSDYKED